jgi:transcriptional regulator with GAF, ATPase, and Fis domain
VDFDSLPSLILAIAEQRSLTAVLQRVIETVAAAPDVGLARVWLRQRDRACPLCAIDASSSEEALHLRASAGQSRSASVDWTRTNGSFHRVALDSPLKLSHMATTGESIRISRLADDPRWLRDPDWARAEGLVGFAGHPLVFRGDTLGVLVVFRRRETDEACWTWLKVMADVAAVAIANAHAFEAVEALGRDLEQERDYLRDEVQDVGAFGDILGHSPALQRVLSQVEMVARTDATVLILGESGTGKELVARAIHQRSPRAAKPLVRVNCAAVPRELFESEFFGHVRGAFTGAVRDRVGRFRLADGGTIFLDEVGEIPLDLQVKLLRVLQEGEFERLGDERSTRVNVRVVAATNRDLKREVAEGRFRLDLYYRLGVFPMEMPPLRDRREDIPLLVSHFMRLASTRFHVPLPRLRRQDLDRAQAYDWPGNVRELQNAVERAVIVAKDGAATLDLAQGRSAAPAPTPAAIATEVVPEVEWRRRERANVLAALRHAEFRVSGRGGAAELLGVNPRTLASRLKALGLDRRRVRYEGDPELSG